MCAMKHLTKEEKVAFALMSVGKEAAAQILKQLPESEVRRINQAFARVQEISRDDQLTITTEFRKLLTAGDKIIVDGEQFARDILHQAFGEDAEMDILGSAGGQNGEILQRLIGELSDTKFVELIKSEHPQTAAFILAKAPYDIASRGLQQLEEERQTDLVMRIAQMNSVRSEITAELCEILRAAVTSQQSSGEEIHGPAVVAKILSQLPRANEERIITEIEEVDEVMADEVRSLMFTFEDLLKVSVRDMQKLLQSVSGEQLVAALKLASPELSEHFYTSMTKRTAERTREEVTDAARMKRRDVELAQQAIIDSARQLEASGAITIGSGDTEDDQWV